MQEISIVNDLYQFQKWLVEDNQTVDVSFKLGGEKRELGIHPSSVCKNDVCSLKIYWEYTGEVEARKPFDHDSQDTFDIGTAKHRMMQTMLHEMFGDQFQSEVAFSIPDWGISGHADGLFTFPNYRFLLEIKTAKESTGKFGFETAARSPFPDNVNQANIYMLGLDVPFGLIFYFCKNNSQKAEHAITYNNKLWLHTCEVIQPVLDAANKTGPMVQAKPSYSCSSCQFLHTCDAGRMRNEPKNPRRWSRR